MQTKTPLRFHWSPRPEDNSSDPARFIGLCQSAEAMGVESVHVPVACKLSDALALVVAAGKETARIRFRIGWDSAAVLESLFGHEMKMAWSHLPGRLVFHLSFATDETGSSESYLRAKEFLANCRRLFAEGESPAFDVEGESAEAAFLAIQRGDCFWRLPNRLNQVYADALPVLHFGKEVGLVSAVIARETREEAMEAAVLLLSDNESAAWVTPRLWIGAVPGWGPKTAALVGSFEEIARAIRDFKQNGVSQLLVRSGDWQEMLCFGSRVMPLVRALE